MSDELTPATLNPLRVGEKAGQSLSLAGGRVIPETFGQLIEFAQMMCKADAAIPKYLRNNPGACMAIIQRSTAWAMDPFAVATKTYVVNEIVAYESQLIAAVVKRWAPVKEKVWNPIYSGEGAERKCTLEVHHLETGELYTYTSPIVGKPFDGSTKEPPRDYVGIWPKNSPLWRYEPDQQLFYYSIRAMARRHWPEILLGVYDPDEARAMKNITPTEEKSSVVNYLNDEPAVDGEVLPPEKKAAPKVEPYDPETGEIIEPIDPPVAPEIIKANLLRQIAAETDKVLLEQWQSLQHTAINELPSNMAKEVRDALHKRHEDLEPY